MRRETIVLHQGWILCLSGRVPMRKGHIDPGTNRVPNFSVSVKDLLIAALGEVWIGEPLVDRFFRGRYNRADSIGIVTKRDGEIERDSLKSVERL